MRKPLTRLFTVLPLAAGLFYMTTAFILPAVENKQPAKANAMTTKETSKSIYDYSYTSLDGKPVKLADFKGKKILFVNTASKCGYTPQYKELEELYEKYKSKMVIIGFPSNQFGEQEPGNSTEIKEFCTKNYGVTFPMSEKIEVKGPNQYPVYQWLTQKALNGKMDSEVKWNFQKYLVDEHGNFVDMYLSAVKPMDSKITSAIEK